VPRIVLPNVSTRLFWTTINYDLFVYNDCLVAVQGLTLRGGVRDAFAGQRPRAQASDRVVIRFDDVSRATLKKRAGIIVALRLSLKDGTRLSWFWMNSSLARPYGEAAPVLRRVLGSVLHQ